MCPCDIHDTVSFGSVTLNQSSDICLMCESPDADPDTELFVFSEWVRWDAISSSLRPGSVSGTDCIREAGALRVEAVASE